MHALPEWMHRMACRATLWIEGPPVAAMQVVLLPWRVARIIVFALYSGLMGAINVSGNYGHLGLLTVTQCVSLLDDDTLRGVGAHVPIQATSMMSIVPAFVSNGSWAVTASIVMGCLAIAPYMAAALVPFYDTDPKFFSRFAPFSFPMWGRVERLHAALEPYLIIGRYVKFAGMTTQRHEVILQVAANENEWRDWPFLYKPTSVDRTPPVALFHMPVA